jgi:hypothetical protein
MNSLYTLESQDKEALNISIEKDLLNGLENLVINTGILYCASCSVLQETLAEYIDSMSVENALQ